MTNLPPMHMWALLNLRALLDHLDTPILHHLRRLDRQHIDPEQRRPISNARCSSILSPVTSIINHIKDSVHYYNFSGCIKTEFIYKNKLNRLPFRFLYHLDDTRLAFPLQLTIEFVVNDFALHHE